MNIQKFKPLERILDYYSFVGNNDVPYPFVITKNYLYYLEEESYTKYDNNYVIDKNNFDDVAIFPYNESPKWVQLKEYKYEILSKRGCGSWVDLLDAYGTNILNFD